MRSCDLGMWAEMNVNSASFLIAEQVLTLIDLNFLWLCVAVQERVKNRFSLAVRGPRAAARFVSCTAGVLRALCRTMVLSSQIDILLEDRETKINMSVDHTSSKLKGEK